MISKNFEKKKLCKKRLCESPSIIEGLHEIFFFEKRLYDSSL